MNPAFTEKLLYSSRTGLPDQFIEGITEQMKDETLFHSAINQDDIDKKFRSSKNSWIKMGFMDSRYYAQYDGQC